MSHFFIFDLTPPELTLPSLPLLFISVFSRHFGQISSVFLVLIPELFFMMSLFGYLVFMVVFKWLAYTPAQSRFAPSILIHFIDMFLFTDNPDNPQLYTGQVGLAALSKRTIPISLHILMYLPQYHSITAYIFQSVIQIYSLPGSG